MHGMPAAMLLLTVVLCCLLRPHPHTRTTITSASQQRGGKHATT